jgi:hypothetical protein
VVVEYTPQQPLAIPPLGPSHSCILKGKIRFGREGQVPACSNAS